MDTTTADLASSPRLERLPLTSGEALANVLMLLSAHGALALFWIVLLSAPFGAWLVWLAPIACLLHQKAVSEWLHEAAHWNFLPSRTWNDRVIQVLAGTFFLEDIEEHRRKHFTHHQRRGFFVDEDLDTATLAVRTRRDVVRGMMRDVLGVTAIRAILQRGDIARARPVTRARRQARILAGGISAYVGVTALLVLAARPASGIPAWIVAPVYLGTLATLYPLFNRLRVYAQHAELGHPGTVASASSASRTLLVDRMSLFDRAFVSSKVMLFHAEHHRYPTLPYRQLEQLALPSDDVNRFATSRIALLTRLYSELPE